MAEKLRDILLQMVSVQGIAGLSVVLGLVVLIFPLMLTVLKVERRADVIRRGAAMNGVLAFAGGLIGLVLFIGVSITNPYMGDTSGGIIFTLLVFFVVFTLTNYLYKKLYIPLIERKVLSGISALIMSFGLLILLF